MNLKIERKSAATVTIQSVSGDNEPTAGSVRLVGRYVLKDTETDKTAARGERSASAFFDRPPQLFAEDRAQRDAVNRAAPSGRHDGAEADTGAIAFGNPSRPGKLEARRHSCVIVFGQTGADRSR